jgi:hypothetical protein
MSDLAHQLTVDHSENRSGLLDAVRRISVFDVRLAHLATGDYLIGTTSSSSGSRSPTSPPLSSTGGCFRKWHD